MNKFLFFGLPVLLLLAACGGPRVVTTPAPPTSPAPAAADTIDLSQLPTTEVAEVAGIAGSPTRYQPWIRRAETPPPPMPFPDNGCHLAVEVRNYDGLDGCGLLLETDTGVLLLPGAAPRGDPLEAGTRISIGWEVMRDYDGPSCGNADAVIRITCMRLLRISSGIPRPVVCEAYDQPSEWLLDAARFNGATYITRFPWRDERFVYLLESPNGQFLYDCRGYLLCQPRKNCLSFIEDFSQGVIIYEG